MAQPIFFNPAAIRRLKEGYFGGLECLMIRCQVKATHAAFLVTRDKARAENMFQKVFLRIFQRSSRFDADLSLRAIPDTEHNRIRIECMSRRKTFHLPWCRLKSACLISLRLKFFRVTWSGNSIRKRDPAFSFYKTTMVEEIATSLIERPPENNFREK